MSRSGLSDVDPKDLRIRRRHPHSDSWNIAWANGAGSSPRPIIGIDLVRPILHLDLFGYDTSIIVPTGPIRPVHQAERTATLFELVRNHVVPVCSS